MVVKLIPYLKKFQAELVEELCKFDIHNIEFEQFSNIFFRDS